ncbi:hypothetical protein PR202_gb01834 [Eleusine coracana subsp. coracana]|uniref:Plant-specific domain TIGR01615 family protein n=1 Tax=Eleusine coracana subsp. coracana TaxID=191504 RepID=A0AAV5DXP8_ELECO|nr:hypothetical protein QOZ80_5BG0414100 [Eleusine coracana subsp. coracana]GJN14955.1 hypothetical protein PR202_gb01834 [Eleusine coracana subsp. coracana]
MVVGEAAAAGGNEMSLSNMVLGFYEEGAERERWTDPEEDAGDDGGSDDEGSTGGGRGSAESAAAFWNDQRSQLHEALLAKTSSAETRIRADTEEAVRHMRATTGGVCSCTAAAAGGCRACALRFVAEKLRHAGYNSAICRSKWSRTLDIPSGEHTYVDVVVPTRSGKAVRVVIELNFRAEFEMARGGAEYKALVAALPEVFVGRTEKLRAVIKVMCAAAKQCARQNHMHMAPWRKHRYMEAKWLGTPERVLPGSAADAVPVGSPEEKQHKFRASMLTLDFGGRTAVEVV